MYSPETPQILVGVFRIESVSVREAATHESIEFHGRQRTPEGYPYQAGGGREANPGY